MADFFLKVGTQICFRDSVDFAPAVANDLRQGTPTNVQLALASTGDTTARQSTKFDLSANRSRAYSIQAAFEMAATGLTAGEQIEVYISWSSDSVAANANPGGVSGSDSAYSGYSSNLADSVNQLDGPYPLIVTGQATPTVQIIDGPTIFPKERYGTLIVKNESGAAFFTDDVETHIVMTPITDLSV